MKSLFVVTLFLFCFLYVNDSALAQVDPSNSLLLKSGTAAESDGNDTTADTDKNLDNGRYVIKTTPAPKPPVQKPAVVKVAPAPPAKPPPAPPTPPQPVAVAAPTPTPAPALTTGEGSPSFVHAVRETFLGGSSDDVSRYKEKLQADDSRRNILEVSIAPGYFYVNSSSNYWYRRYFSDGPGIDANAHIWFTPFMGVNLGYFTTLTADMNASPTTSRTFSAQHRYTDFSFDFRKYFSYSKRSPSLRFSLGFNEYQLVVPPAETYRIGLQEYGVDLGLHLTMPTSVTTAWTLGTDIIPFMHVNEQSTGTNAQSGSSPSSFAAKFSLGQEFTLDRNNKVFWRLSERIDKSVYSGTATVADPMTGSAPSGVSATSAATLFEFGYSWGD